MMHPNGPKIKLKLTPIDKLLEMLGLGALIVMWIFVVYNYSKLPPTIPIHFDSSGIIDGYGSKSMIWGLLLVGSIMYVGMTYLNKFPHVFNFLTQITEESALRQYTIATKMLRFIKLGIILMVSYLAFKTVRIALGKAFVLDAWLLPLFFSLLFLSLIYFIVLMIFKR